jgi:gamma-glutamyl-gamma-aminobutyrate hydrolase PuuD
MLLMAKIMAFILVGEEAVALWVNWVPLFFLLFSTAKADLLFWTPHGQNAIYVLPEETKPEAYLKKVKGSQSLEGFVRNMIFSDNDVVITASPQVEGADSRAVFVANSQQDHEFDHQRLNNFGKHYKQLFVIPVGATKGLNYLQKDKFYRQLGEHFKLVTFMGGEDLDPRQNGEKLTWSKNTNRERDVLEAEIVRGIFFKTSAKILGVCRGLQRVVTSLGGKLYQDLKLELNTTERHENGEDHRIYLMKTKNGILGDLIRIVQIDSFMSYHHQAVRPESLKGTVFEAAAESQEGVIEALESRDNRILLLQFHPEKAKLNQADAFFRGVQAWVKSPLTKKCAAFF